MLSRGASPRRAALVVNVRNRFVFMSSPELPDRIAKKKKELPNSLLVEEMYGVNDRGNDVLDILEPLLSNKETIVVYYKAVFSYTWDEIYEETGIPSSTARLIYKTAKEKLRKELR